MGLKAVKLGITRKVSDATETGWAIAREAGASLLTYELYPLGLVGDSLPVLPTLWQKKREEPRLPILFIHGIFHNRSAFAWLVQKLAVKGWRQFHEINLFTTLHSIPRMAEQTAFHVQNLLDKYKVPQLDIVAHSMGGIIARYFVQLMGGDGIVRHLITLGTPHQGTKWGQYSLLPHIRELMPNSPTLTELRHCPPPHITQGLSVSGNLDIFIQPRNGAWWEGVRNIQLKRVGHAGLLFSKRVAQIIASRLKPIV